SAPAGMAVSQLPKFNQQIMQSLMALNIPLPNKEVPYGHTWEHPTNLFIETRSRYEAALFKMNLKYVGVRDRGGRQEAVIEITGNLAKDPNLKAIDAKDLKGGAPPAAAGDAPPNPGGGGGAGGGGSSGGVPLRQTTRPKAPPATTKGFYGLAKGYAYVDVANGFVAEVKLFIDLDAELTVK